MIELRTLGEVGLHVAGTAPRVIVEHPKRLAVFAYLVAAPAAIHQRETVMAMFWPDLPGDRARAALRKVLYFIRSAVGDNVVLNQGDNALVIDRTGIRCDATALQLASDNGEDETVLKLDRGEFMSGFHLDNAPDFEDWLDRSRQRIRAASVRATLRLARRLEQHADDLAIPVMDDFAQRLELDHGDRRNAIAAYEESLRLRFRLQQQMILESEAVAAKLRSLKAVLSA